jgi:hypothetical protein
MLRAVPALASVQFIFSPVGAAQDQEYGIEQTDFEKEDASVRKMHARSGRRTEAYGVIARPASSK